MPPFGDMNGGLARITSAVSFQRYRALIPEYVKDYVSLNQFAP
jgi:hypothetical protein